MTKEDDSNEHQLNEYHSKWHDSRFYAYVFKLNIFMCIKSAMKYILFYAYVCLLLKYVNISLVFIETPVTMDAVDGRH